MNDKVTNGAPLGAIIKVIGVGGGGGNAIKSMMASGITGVEFIAANTDVQALQSNPAPLKIQLGRELTKGLGAGANPEIGRDAALEDKAIIQEVLSGADMVFVTAGMGGGTGTGAAPIIAQVARELGALTLGVVTKPFAFEGRKRKAQCDLGIQGLKASVDTLITIPNQRLLSIAPPNMTMLDSFKLADEVLVNAVRGISDIINVHGHLNVDFADVKKIMSSMGMALMGIGTSSGPNRATEAARAAISSPLLEDVDIEGATGLLINITSSSSITLQEINEACTLIQESAHEDAEVIFGQAFDDSLGEMLRITVIATGFDQANITLPAVDSFRSYPQMSSHQMNPGYGMQQGNPYGNQQPQGHVQNAPQNHMNVQTRMPQTTFSGEARTVPSGVGLQNVPRGTQANTTPQNNMSLGSQAPQRASHDMGQQGYRGNGSVQPMGYEQERLANRMNSQSLQNPLQNPTHAAAQPAATNTLGALSAQTRQTHDARVQSGTTAHSLGNTSPNSQSSAQGNVGANHNAQPRNVFESVASGEPNARTKSEAEELTAWTLQQSRSSHTEAFEAAERSLSGANYSSHEEEDRKATETALSLAEELSNVEIDDTDFETPAFLRRKDDHAKNV